MAISISTLLAVFASVILVVSLAQVQLNVASPESTTDKSQRTNNLAAGEATKVLVLLIGVDETGKVSREQFMTLMEAEFDRLDMDNSGKLDIHKLVGLNRGDTANPIQVRSRQLSCA